MALMLTFKFSRKYPRMTFRARPALRLCSSVCDHGALLGYFICIVAALRFAQGVSGRILFGEQLPGQWFYGATFIVAGVAFIAGSDGQLQEKSKVT